jgi:hypothetical protein
MSVAPEELDCWLADAPLSCVTPDENSRHLRRRVDDLETRVDPGALQAECSGDPITDHPFVD